MADFAPGQLPDVGDVNQYIAKGQQLVGQASQAIGGNSQAQMALVQDGVSLLGSSGGQIVPIAMSVVSSAMSGFAIAGPWGAVAGAAVGTLEAALSGSGNGFVVWYGSGNSPGLSPAQLDVLARIQRWNKTSVNPPFQIDPNTGAPFPQGWSLYNYLGQEVRDPSQPSVCTPYLWILDLNKYGCITDGSFAENGTDPAVAQKYLTSLQGDLVQNGYLTNPPSTDKTKPGGLGMSVNDAVAYLVKRAPPPHFYAAQNVVTPIPDNGGFRFFAGAFMPDVLLTLATIMGMLQVGASQKAIASELLMQRWMYSSESETPDPLTQQLMDWAVSEAHQADQAAGYVPGQPIDWSKLKGLSFIHVPPGAVQHPATTSTTTSWLVGTAVVGGLAAAGLKAYAVHEGTTMRGAVRQIWRKVRRRR